MHARRASWRIKIKPRFFRYRDCFYEDNVKKLRTTHKVNCHPHKISEFPLTQMGHSGHETMLKIFCVEKYFNLKLIRSVWNPSSIVEVSHQSKFGRCLITSLSRQQHDFLQYQPERINSQGAVTRRNHSL